MLREFINSLNYKEEKITVKLIKTELIQYDLINNLIRGNGKH